jgi:hypothetical protein
MVPAHWRLPGVVCVGGPGAIDHSITDAAVPATRRAAIDEAGIEGVTV